MLSSDTDSTRSFGEILEFLGCRSKKLTRKSKRKKKNKSNSDSDSVQEFTEIMKDCPTRQNKEDQTAYSDTESDRSFTQCLKNVGWNKTSHLAQSSVKISSTNHGPLLPSKAAVKGDYENADKNYENDIKSAQETNVIETDQNVGWLPVSTRAFKEIFERFSCISKRLFEKNDNEKEINNNYDSDSNREFFTGPTKLFPTEGNMKIGRGSDSDSNREFFGRDGIQLPIGGQMRIRRSSDTDSNRGFSQCCACGGSQRTPPPTLPQAPSLPTVLSVADASAIETPLTIAKAAYKTDYKHTCKGDDDPDKPLYQTKPTENEETPAVEKLADKNPITDLMLRGIQPEHPLGLIDSMSHRLNKAFYRRSREKVIKQYECGQRDGTPNPNCQELKYYECLQAVPCDSVDFCD